MVTSVSDTQTRDSCLALILLLLIIWLITRLDIVIYACIAVVFLGMIWPRIFSPFAVVWYGLAKFLGRIFSAFILGIIWFVLVLPVGALRRLLGHDRLALRQWHNGAESCFVIREYIYSRRDFDQLF